MQPNPAAWLNFVNHLDVSDDGVILPRDALLIINALNRRNAGVAAEGEARFVFHDPASAEDEPVELSFADSVSTPTLHSDHALRDRFFAQYWLLPTEDEQDADFGRDDWLRTLHRTTAQRVQPLLPH